MEIKISRSNRRCHASGREFMHEDEIVSLVRYVDGALAREDYARENWSEDNAREAYSVWTTRYYDPNAVNQEEEESFSPLRRIFYDALERGDRDELAVAFLAAQLLRRQKVFRQVRESEETEEGGKILLYVDRIGNKLIEARDPNFTYAELETARLRLMDRLMAAEAPPAENLPSLEEEAASGQVAETEKELAPEVEDETALAIVAESGEGTLNDE